MQCRRDDLAVGRQKNHISTWRLRTNFNSSDIPIPTLPLGALPGRIAEPPMAEPETVQIEHQVVPVLKPNHQWLGDVSAINCGVCEHIANDSRSLSGPYVDKLFEAARIGRTVNLVSFNASQAAASCV